MVKIQNLKNEHFFHYSHQGATIKADEETGRILIARVMHGGAADRSGFKSLFLFPFHLWIASSEVSAFQNPGYYHPSSHDLGIR